MKKYRNKYRILSTRLQDWDYRRDSAYFITICTQNRENYFGEISYGVKEMKLSPVGVIADILWHEIKNHTTNAELGAFIVMPNHIHGILIINNFDNVKDPNTPDCNMKNVGTTVETLHATSPHPHPHPHPHPPSHSPNRLMSDISPKEGSVSAIIRSYKSAVTRHAHRLGYNFEWQTRFHDHIIRNQQSFHRITEYIIKNPKNWKGDRFHDK